MLDEYDDADALKHVGVLKIYEILLTYVVVHLLVWIINCGESTCSRRNDDLSSSVAEIMSYSSINTVTAYGCDNWGVIFAIPWACTASYIVHAKDSTVRHAAELSFPSSVCVCVGGVGMCGAVPQLPLTSSCYDV
jgi:hypothetical protein